MTTLYLKNGFDLKAAVIKLYELAKTAQGKVIKFSFEISDEKTREQEKKYHAMIGDIAKQARHLNKVLDEDSWKRLCVKQFADDCIANLEPHEKLYRYWTKNKFELIPSLDGRSLVVVGAQTRKFPRYVAIGFVEWLYHYGAENQIVWSDPKYQDEYEEFAA